MSRPYNENRLLREFDTDRNDSKKKRFSKC